MAKGHSECLVIKGLINIREYELVDLQYILPAVAFLQIRFQSLFNLTCVLLLLFHSEAGG